jgi:uncharacterized protein YuzE
MEGLNMNKTTMTYFKKDDIIHLILSEGEEFGSFEIAPNITAELNEKGDLIGIEILRASEFIRDYILESVQAKILKLSLEQKVVA